MCNSENLVGQKFHAFYGSFVPSKIQARCEPNGGIAWFGYSTRPSANAEDAHMPHLHWIRFVNFEEWSLSDHGRANHQAILEARGVHGTVSGLMPGARLRSGASTSRVATDSTRMEWPASSTSIINLSADDADRLLPTHCDSRACLFNATMSMPDFTPAKLRACRGAVILRVIRLELEQDPGFTIDRFPDMSQDVLARHLAKGGVDAPVTLQGLKIDCDDRTPRAIVGRLDLGDRVILTNRHHACAVIRCSVELVRCWDPADIEQAGANPKDLTHRIAEWVAPIDIVTAVYRLQSKLQQGQSRQRQRGRKRQGGTGTPYPCTVSALPSACLTPQRRLTSQDLTVLHHDAILY